MTGKRLDANAWIALLGRQDRPTDGVEDYCIFLGRALAEQGVKLERVRVQWDQDGRIGALRQLSRECAEWRGRWVLLQYTALAWSRRGFPFLALLVCVVLRRGGARVAVVFHDPHRQGGPRWIDRIRGVCQDWVIRGLHRRAAKAIFTVPLDSVDWLPKGEDKSAFIPIGANIPERADRRLPPASDEEKTVIVFGVTEAPVGPSEAEYIAAIMKGVGRILTKVKLTVIGRGSLDAQVPLQNALDGSGVDLVVRGVLPAEEVAREFERADALLFIRGAITHWRGSALAGIACGLPLVGYHNGHVSGPLKEAGVEWSRGRDQDSLVRGLVRVLSDSSRWTELHERNLAVQKNHLSWSRIAERYRSVFGE
jgi:glycosyltransferase involved in cell wall biosynthesis